MKKTIFISSTFEDLQPHRKAIWELLEDYEVHVNGMERFGARKDAPIDTCLSAVERSDIYLGIIAYRLGNIHPVHKKSYTQLEYEKAAHLGKEILIYFIDDKEALVNYKDIDFGEAYEKLNNFKQTLKEKHTIDFFRSPEDLTQKLKHCLNDLLARKEREDFSDDYHYSRDIIEKFHLFPKIYSDREIKLRVKIKKDAFPASIGICDAFGLNFGETLGVPIEIVEPNLDNNRLEHIFITENLSDIYFKNRGSSEIEILGRLLFSDRRVVNLGATLFDENKMIRKPNPNYNSRIPSYDNCAFNTIQEIVDNQKFITETKTIEGESTAIILLIKMY